MSTEKTLDIVIFGATGFTGKLICEHLKNIYGTAGKIAWGIAGRNAEKLEAVRQELDLGDVPKFVADSNDITAVDAVVGQCKVLLNAAGPYQIYGSTVVESCARLGTDYIDLAGEPVWMHKMLVAHEETAKNSGARIVLSGGFDSVPSDLGVQYLQEEALQRFGKPMSRVKFRVKAMNGQASGGTVASFNATMAAAKENPQDFAILSDPFALTPGFVGPKQPEGDKKEYEEDIDSRSAPFIMAPINTKNVHRTNFLTGHSYGEDFIYDEKILLRKKPAEVAKEKPKEEKKEGSAFGFDLSMKPGDGPSKEEREAGFYEIWMFGFNSSGEKLKAIVTGDRDPGYGSTSKMIAEAAVCLAQTEKSNVGGFLTPAFAMGTNLRSRLIKNAGLSFSIDAD